MSHRSGAETQGFTLPVAAIGVTVSSMRITRSRLGRAALVEVLLLAASTVGWLMLGGDATPLLAGITAALLMSGVLFGFETRRIRARHTRFVNWCAGVALMFIPWLCGWGIASIVIEARRSDDQTVRAWFEAHSTARPKKCVPWNVGGRPIVVALALSGGGYRAALTHAGVLAALDDRCVPLTMLSTVSGGSIVGASYAMGVPPREFATRLSRQKPGFVETRLSMQNAWKRTSELYLDHLRRTYFGDRSIGSLPTVPILVLNATSLGSPTHIARVALWKDRSGIGVGDALPLADAVAASSAFPGAFQSIQVGGVAHDIEGAWMVNRTFSDGGVVENLGIEGLRIFLADRMRVDRRNIPPDLLIVSDASRYGGLEEGMFSGGRPLDQLLRSNQVQFDELHRRVYKDVTGIDDVSSQVGDSPMVFTADYPTFFLAKDSPKPGGVIPGQLRTIVVPATREATDAVLANHTTCPGPSGEPPATVRAKVSGFSTLRELTPLEVREAFWLGYTLGDAYGVAMECARSQITGVMCAAPPKIPQTDCANNPAILQP